MARATKRNVIARIGEGDIEAVIFLKQNVDGYRYPVFVPERIHHSHVGNRLPNKTDFFDYNVDNMNKAAIAARRFIARYKANPKAALDELRKQEPSQAKRLAA